MYFVEALWHDKVCLDEGTLWESCGRDLTKTCPMHILRYVGWDMDDCDAGSSYPLTECGEDLRSFHSLTDDLSASRACTGFDGGLEVRVAIRGPFPRIKTELNINANDNLAIAA